MAEEVKTGTAGPAAADAAAGTSPQGQSTKEESKEAPASAQAAKTYDQAYVDRLLQEQEKAREEAVAEALKVAGMDAEKKAAYEKEQAEKRLADREAEIARRELKADARGILAEKEIPAEFLDVLLGKDLKETKANADTFKGLWDRAVQAQVEKRLVGKTPQGGNGGTVDEAAAMRAEMEKYL